MHIEGYKYMIHVFNFFVVLALNTCMVFIFFFCTTTGEVFVDYGWGQALMVTNLGLTGAAGRAYTYFDTDTGDMTYRYLE